MPSLLIATRKLPDGTIDKVTTPFDDYGSGSIQSAQEEQRLKALGYETKIVRQGHEQVTEK